MKTERTHTRKGLRRFIACLIVAVMLLGVTPAFAEESIVPSVGPFQGIVEIDVSAKGFGTTGMVLDYVNITLSIDSVAKVADLRISILDKDVDIIFAWDDGALRFTIPQLGNEVYGITANFIQELADKISPILSKISNRKVETVDLQPIVNAVTGFVSKYLTADTLAVGQEPYTFAMLSGTANGYSITWSLTAEQWKSFIADALQLVTGNETLLQLVASNTGMDAETLRNKLTLSDAELDKAAESLNGYKIVLYYEGETLRAISFGNDDAAILYEVKGSLAEGERIAAIGQQNMGTVSRVLTNTLDKKSNGYFGKLEFINGYALNYSLEDVKNGGKKLALEFSTGSQSVGLSFTYAPGAVSITVPGPATKQIDSLEDAGNVLQTIGNSASSLLF